MSLLKSETRRLKNIPPFFSGYTWLLIKCFTRKLKLWSRKGSISKVAHVCRQVFGFLYQVCCFSETMQDVKKLGQKRLGENNVEKYSKLRKKAKISNSRKFEKHSSKLTKIITRPSIRQMGLALLIESGNNSTCLHKLVTNKGLLACIISTSSSPFQNRTQPRNNI